jgi:hypothetical protein
MEDIVLFDAPDAKAARALAEQHGRSESNEDDLTFTCDERPAYWDYAGIRMIMECDDNERRPGSGTELTYLEYRVGSPEEVKALIAGGAVFVEFG